MVALLTCSASGGAANGHGERLGPRRSVRCVSPSGCNEGLSLLQALDLQVNLRVYGRSVIATRYRIGQLAGIAGVSPSALRFYEEAGLLQPGERSEAGYRLYGPEAAGRLQFIRRAQGLGLTLGEIHRLLDRRLS